jgi:hypothetical protein
VSNGAGARDTGKNPVKNIFRAAFFHLWLVTPKTLNSSAWLQAMKHPEAKSS